MSWKDMFHEQASQEKPHAWSNRTACLWVSLGLACSFGVGGRAEAQTILFDNIGNDHLETRPSTMDYLGDVDGDGVRDIIYGCEGARYAAIRSGADGSMIHRKHYPWENSDVTLFATAVARVGDMDFDGVSDYAISSPGIQSPEGHPRAGRVQFFSGATHEELLRIHGQGPYEYIGMQIALLGDVDGDGSRDLAVNPTSIAGGGPLRLYSGLTGVEIREHPFITLSPKGISAYIDWDGDGHDEYLVGERSSHQGAPWGGRVIMFSGKTGEELLDFEGVTDHGFAGLSVSVAGDWNGDGVMDVAAGAPATGGWQSTNYFAGAYVFSGADGSILHYFDGEEYCEHNSLFGRSVSSGKDVNGDGVPDLIVGAPFEPYAELPYWRGSTFLFSGATKSLLWERKGEMSAENLGTYVQLIDDHNDDGFDDWMVLSPFYDIDLNSNYPEAGRITILAGAPGDAHPVCTAGANSVGSGARLWNSGPISVNQNEFELAVSEMPQGSLVILMHGELVPPNPFGAGELCLGLPLGVAAIGVTDTDGAPGEPAQARLGLDFEGLPFTAGGNQVLAGDRWTFQALYRDQGLRNSSNALRVVFLP